jgi:hypothetical protein
MLNEDLKNILKLLNAKKNKEELSVDFFEKEFNENLAKMLVELKKSKSSSDEEKDLALISARSCALNLEQLFTELLETIEEDLQ